MESVIVLIFGKVQIAKLFSVENANRFKSVEVQENVFVLKINALK